MTTQETLLAILGGVLGSLLCYAAEQWWDKRFKWKCPEKSCNFRIRSNNKELIQRVSRDHKEKFHVRREP